MFVWAKERSYRGQTKHLFPKDRPTEVREDQKEKTDQGHPGRQEVGTNQKDRSRLIEVEGCSDQKGETERARIQSKDERSCSDQIQNSEIGQFDIFGKIDTTISCSRSHQKTQYPVGKKVA